MYTEHLQLPPGVKPNQTIPEYFSGKNVFITGATGFMGKVLVEKLLRSCPDVGIIYVLIRVKKRKNVQDRWKNTVDCEYFSKLNEINKNALQKVKVLEGDVILTDLGLSPQDKEDLINNVSIIYHSAATVRFDETLKSATIMNVKGTKEVCKLALEIKNLELFMHVSTAFSQCNDYLEEKLYPPRDNPHKLIEMCETMDPTLLKILTSKYCEGFPNTYTFTKCLAETIVKNMCEGKVPTVIYRPSIVTPPMTEPFVGWVENLNGPVGLVFAGTKGVLRVLKTDKNKELDYLPVDTAIQGMIKATWYQSFIKDLNIAVYNCSKTDLFRFNVNDQTDKGAVMLQSNNIWCKPVLDYSLYLTKSNLIFWYMIYTYQFLPAILADIVMRIMGKKPIILKFLSKVVSTLVTTSYFSLKDWRFNNQKFIELDDYLMVDDQLAYGNRLKFIDKDKWLQACYINICKKMGDGDCAENCRSYQRLKYVYMLKNGVIYAIYGIVFYSYILQPFYDQFCDYVINL